MLSRYDIVNDNYFFCVFIHTFNLSKCNIVTLTSFGVTQDYYLVITSSKLLSTTKFRSHYFISQPIFFICFCYLNWSLIKVFWIQLFFRYSNHLKFLSYHITFITVICLCLPCCWLQRYLFKEETQNYFVL